MQRFNIKDWREQGGKRMKLARTRARNGKGYTLRDVSEALPDYSISRLHGYESGYRGMTPDVADEIGRFLGVTAAYLLCVDDYADHVEGVDDEARFFLLRWRDASDEVREIVRDILSRHTR